MLGVLVIELDIAIRWHVGHDDTLHFVNIKHGHKYTLYMKREDEQKQY